ncbi:MAG: dodecin domain-containing protein [Chloroflexota bacterium]|nr:dodecin domain-containing protein [Chloroflexota bacterium]MDE3192495.1 dodecin domain-containing protein [Chloroflexota bacterium]
MPRSRSTASRASRPSRAKAAPAAVRTVEVTGSSRRGWADAVTSAVRDAKDTAPRPVVAEVSRLWAELDARGGIRQYRAAVKVAYRVPLAPAAKR